MVNLCCVCGKEANPLSNRTFHEWEIVGRLVEKIPGLPTWPLIGSIPELMISMIMDLFSTICYMLFSILLSACAFHIYTRYGRIGKYINKMPGPTAWPIVGNLLAFMVPFERLWHVIRSLNNEYYPFYRTWSFSIASVHIRHPDDVEAILNNSQHIEKSLIYKLLHSWFGTGLLTSTGIKWQQRRKILTGAFHFNILQKYMAIIVENSEKLSMLLKAEGESVQNLVPLLTNYTLNVICEAAMGITLVGKEQFQEKYRNAIHEMAEVLVYRLVRPWLFSEWIFQWTLKGRQQKKALQILHGFSKKIIKERKDYHKKTNYKFLKNLNNVIQQDTTENDVDIRIGKRRLAMLDLMIDAQNNGENIDDCGMREEVDTFMFEGHDTLAMGICFILLLLAEHKDIQIRARAEVNEVFAESNGKITIAEIQRLEYLDRCIKEALRLYPSVPYISRNINHDLQLKKYVIPRGTIAHIHIYDIHRDPNFWPEPKKFDPDRFISNKAQFRHPYSYVPFSAGPRNCIGQKFAMIELKSITAHLLRDFHLKAIDFAHEVPILPDLVLRPARSVYLRFAPIKK